MKVIDAVPISSILNWMAENKEKHCEMCERTSIDESRDNYSFEEDGWSDEYFTFNSRSRERYLRNILCELKSEITGSQNDFQVEFDPRYIPEKVRDSFEYRFVISPRVNVDIDDWRIIERHHKLRDFVSNTLDYLFSKDVKINMLSWRESLTTEFTLRSI